MDTTKEEFEAPAASEDAVVLPEVAVPEVAAEASKQKAAAKGKSRMARRRGSRLGDEVETAKEELEVAVASGDAIAVSEAEEAVIAAEAKKQAAKCEITITNVIGTKWHFSLEWTQTLTDLRQAVCEATGYPWCKELKHQRLVVQGTETPLSYDPVPLWKIGLENEVVIVLGKVVGFKTAATTIGKIATLFRKVSDIGLVDPAADEPAPAPAATEVTPGRTGAQ